MRWFNNLSIGTRIYTITFLAAAILILSGGMALMQLRETMHANIATKTRHIVDTAQSIIAGYAEMEKKGLLTREEAQQRAIETIKTMRYNGSEYFWINDMYPRMIMHPTKPELDGKDISNVRDPNGVALFVEMAKHVKATGEGFVNYRWPRPGETEPKPKISFVKGFRDWGWIVGSGVYVDDIDAAVHNAIVRQSSQLAVVLVIMLALAFYISRSITKPLHSATSVMNELARGNLTVEVGGTDRKDEVGMMANAIEIFRKQALKLKDAERKAQEMEQQARAERQRTMQEMANQFEASVSGVIRAITESAMRMQTTAQSLNTIAMGTREKASIVAAAAQETSTSSSTVAAASEELSASIQEISRQVQRSNTIAQEVVTGTNSANEAMETLLQQTDSISQVTVFISKVASQINLLALNATIESARAGEAGKGFAVVAGEVKNLASQTTQASSDISAQIGNIQTASGSAEHQLKQVNDVISQITQSISSIAAAIEQQAAATKEIVRNVNESSRAAADVSRNIVDVEQSASTTDSTAKEVLESAQQLGEKAKILQESVGQFLVTIRSTGT